MILIDDHTSTDLEQLAENHYTLLTLRNNPRAGQVLGDFKAKSLVGRIKAKKAVSVAANEQQQVDFWDFLLDNNEAKLKELIISRPSRLKQLIQEIDQQFTNAMFSVNNSFTDASLTPFGTIVAEAFAYQAMYRNKDLCVTVFEQLRLRVCPYCNITPVECLTYTPRLSNELKRTALHQLDHFYPQSRHPYLALSFFNLIPGCPYCNGHLKSQMDFDIDTHFNPYDKRLDDHFLFEVNSTNADSPDLLEFQHISRQGSTFLDYALVDLEVTSRYNQWYKNLIYDMMNCIRFNGPDVGLSHMMQMPDVFTTPLAAHDSLLKGMGVPRNRNEINNYPLGKLKRDICLQMDMLVP
ncbi:hypothetical protein [Mucilaginibacter flavus]|uniref:hypothetical protein n=1 Tax=Mucilaginibacter flavus TaxID=931504 RepID=UPI0025B2BC86|nr:hypothetical protein [Mucilaginibacter flavus]MDN3584626.1 hypothetical protein [Mucilaginibacter flavus]